MRVWLSGESTWVSHVRAQDVHACHACMPAPTRDVGRAAVEGARHSSGVLPLCCIHSTVA